MQASSTGPQGESMTRQSVLLAACFAALASAVGCVGRPGYHMPPAERMMHPGPGVDGPGPGVMVPPGPMAGMGAGATSEVAFLGPDGMEVSWDVTQPGAFDSEPIYAPGRYNFAQMGLYRLRLRSVPGREGEEFYPTVEVAPATPRSQAFLAHSAIPVQFTEEDFQQVASGNFVTKVIYLPYPEFQELAIAGVETIVSTRLDPGVDPIEEADERGAILAIVRIGNKDLTTPGASAGDVMQAGYMYGDGSGGSDGCEACSAAAGGMGGGSGVPVGPIAGMNAPQYGMPHVGTPIGLPGPPHIPLGGEAGLRKHVMRNYTPMHIPHPVHRQSIHVAQVPGEAYPRPARRAVVVEANTPTH